MRQSSRFDRPHKVVASAHARILPRFGGTEISVLYVGQSGLPYSYVYKGDVNGDGFPGPRASSLSNDLLFIPDEPGQFPFAGFGSLAMWSTLFELEGLPAGAEEPDPRAEHLLSPHGRTRWISALDRP